MEFVFSYIGNHVNDQHRQESCHGVEIDEPGEVVGAGTRYRNQFQYLGREVPYTAVESEYAQKQASAYATMSGPKHYRAH